jgi:hypothetical protein
MSVVNIDNGFGAGYAAARIVALAAESAEAKSSKTNVRGKIQAANSKQRVRNH